MIRPVPPRPIRLSHTPIVPAVVDHLERLREVESERRLTPRRPALKATIRRSRRGSWWIVELHTPRGELVGTAPFDTWAQAIDWVTGRAPGAGPRLKRLSLRAILTGGQP